MCCVSFVSSGSASKRIDGRARSPLSHGFGGAISEPTAGATMAQTATSRSMLREQRTDARLDVVATLVVKALLDRDDVALAIDQERARHAFHVVRCRRPALRAVVAR